MNRVVAEAAEPEANTPLTSAYLLAGLRLPRQRVMPLFQGVRAMRDSDAYLAILGEGEVRGAQRVLLRQGRLRSGEPDEAAAAGHDLTSIPFVPHNRWSRRRNVGRRQPPRGSTSWS